MRWQNDVSKAPNVRQVIDRWNKLCSWIGEQIVQEHDLGKRVQKVQQFIAIGQVQNYHRFSY